MNHLEPSATPAASWLKPSVEEQGLQRYVATIRERKWLILCTILITTLAAVAYVAFTHKVYSAEATLLVTPVPRRRSATRRTRIRSARSSRTSRPCAAALIRR